MAFYHRHEKTLPNIEKIMLCQGTEERGKRLHQYVKPELGYALANEIVTT